MTVLLERHAKKIAILALVLFAMTFLTGCRGAAWQDTPYTTWADEFRFTGFFSGLFGLPLAILSFPFAWILSMFGTILGGSFFFAILFFTIFIRTIAWPVYTKQNNMSLQMQLMQPEMQNIQRKYATRKDPESQRRMQMEMQQLYKKYGMNPLGCIGMMLIQMPIFMTMFEVLRRVNVNGYTITSDGIATLEKAGRFAFESQTFLGIFDLNYSFNLFAPITSFRDSSNNGTLASTFFVIVIALLVFAVNFYQQRRTMKKSEERRLQSVKTYGGREQAAAPSPQANQMKWMSIIMPIMFIPMSLNNAALGVYWLIGGLYTLFQHEVGRRRTEAKINNLNKQN